MPGRLPRVALSSAYRPICFLTGARSHKRIRARQQHKSLQLVGRPHSLVLTVCRLASVSVAASLRTPLKEARPNLNPINCALLPPRTGTVRRSIRPNTIREDSLSLVWTGIMLIASA